MIRKLSITDKKQYLELLQQLTEVGNITDAKWFILFQNIEKCGNIEIYVFVGVRDNSEDEENSETTDDASDINDDKNKEVILAAGTLLIEQKFIHGGAVVGHIEDVVVAEKARGLGLGRQMIEHLVQKAKDHGAYKVILDTKEATTGFYSKLGFHQKEVQMRYDI